jgi:hypothetical protein
MNYRISWLRDASESVPPYLMSSIHAERVVSCRRRAKQTVESGDTTAAHNLTIAPEGQQLFL